MYRFLFPITLSLALTVGPVLAAPRRPLAGPQVIGFTEAVGMAFRDSPSLKRVHARRSMARAELEAQRGRLLPHLVLLWEAQRSNNPLAVLGEELGERKASFADLGLGEYTGSSGLNAIPPALNQPGYANEFTTALLLTIPVWSWGGRREEIAAAEARRSAAGELLRAARGALTLEVLRRYEGVASARALLRAARADRRMMRVVLRVTAERARRGLALPSDLLRARAADAKSRLLVARMISGLATALDDFRLTLGVSSRRPLLPARSRLRVRPLTGTLLRAEDEALAVNPDLLAVDRRVEARRHLVAAAQARRWPSLSLSLEHDWNDGTPGFRAPSNTFLATVRWPLFTFGAERGRVGVARARLRSARAERTASRRRLRVRISRLWRGVRLARLRFHVALLARKAARSSAHALLLRYRHGLATLGDLLRAEARVERTQAEVVEARYAWLLEQAALRFAAGRLNPRDVVSSREAP